MPDYSAAALNSVLELLTSGTTVENNLDKKQVEEIKNLAKELSINVSGIATSNQYYEIVDSSENNPVVSESKVEKAVNTTDNATLKSNENKPPEIDESCPTDKNDSSTDSDGSAIKESLLSNEPIDEDNDFDTLSEHLVPDGVSEGIDELLSDSFDGEDDSVSSFENGIKLNSTSNVERVVNSKEKKMLRNHGMESEMNEDFEFFVNFL